MEKLLVRSKISSHNKCNSSMDSVLRVFVVAFIGFTGLSTIALSSNVVSADTSSIDTVSTTVPASCSFTSASASSYGATILNGQTSTITGDPITATCNDASGYAVYAIGYSGDTYTGDYHTDMISALNNSYNIKTNGTNGASYWKMKLQDLSNAVIANSYGDFQVIPSSFTKVASYTSNTQAASFTPVYQIYIGTTQPADAYTGKVKYTLVHPNTMVAGTYSIFYNANGGTGTMTSTTGIYNFEEQILPESTFTAPSGYVFAGWCTTNTGGSYACDGTNYAAGSNLPASSSSSATASGTLNLYAVWRLQRTIENTAYLQDVESCPATLTVGQVYSLTDSRDNTSYHVAKLADGNCWMLDNLALDISDSSVRSAMNTTNTNTTNDGLAVLANTVVSNSATYTAPYIIIARKDMVNPATLDGEDTWKYGGLYNYCAASGGTICTDSSTSDATYDICPAGWRLPSGDTSGEFGLLYSTYYTTASSFRTDLHLPLSGFFHNGDTDSGSRLGVWWSSTDVDSTDMYNLYADRDGAINAADYSSRNLGFSIRCILK